MCIMDAYKFLLDSYKTETLKTLGIWSAFPESTLEYRPHTRSRSLLDLRVPSVYGPTADTDGKVVYSFTE